MTYTDPKTADSKNIDPVWVTQAIAERVAEVLGDWAAVILKSSDSTELRVASIYHREMASLGLAWSYFLLSVAQTMLQSTWALYTGYRYQWDTRQVGLRKVFSLSLRMSV